MGFPEEDPVRVTVPQMMAMLRSAVSAARRSQPLLGLVKKILFFQKIARRISGERQLRKNGDIGPGLSGALGEGENALGVAIEIADGAVGLREGDSHRVNTIVRWTRRGLPSTWG